MGYMVKKELYYERNYFSWRLRDKIISYYYGDIKAAVTSL
jgi:hypothetical protein